MKILVISYFDDNFGDMLIRICFKSLLRTALKNLDIAETAYEIEQMALKKVDRKQVQEAELIFFAGGGLFGLSYLGFYEYLEEILELAEENKIPVYFSSIGVNNMDATQENEQRLCQLLKKDCIRKISVRENKELFQKYMGERALDIQLVCDPAVWTKEVYAKRILQPLSKEKKYIGINVVRGKLFRDNHVDWEFKDELKYLLEMKVLLDQSDYDYRFYTNGSVLDNNALRFWAEENQIPEEKVVYVHSSEDLVQTIAQFDAIASIRMHSSILAYSFGIPAVNLVWNEKIRCFYENIALPERAISLENWKAEMVYTQLHDFLEHPVSIETETYRMTVYEALFSALSSYLNGTGSGNSGLNCANLSCYGLRNRDSGSSGLGKADSGSSGFNSRNYREKENIYHYDQVREELKKMPPSWEEEQLDLRVKVEKSEHHYLARHYDLNEKRQEIKNLKKDHAKVQKNLEEEKKQHHKTTEELADVRKMLKTTQQELEKTKNLLKKREEELNRMNRWLPVKLYRSWKKRFHKGRL